MEGGMSSLPGEWKLLEDGCVQLGRSTARARELALLMISINGGFIFKHCF